MVIVEEEGEEDGIELKGRSCCGTANQAADGDIANSALYNVQKGVKDGGHANLDKLGDRNAGGSSAQCKAESSAENFLDIERLKREG